MKFLNGQLLLDSSLTGTTGIFTSGITSDNIFVGRKSGPIPTLGNDNIAIGVDNFSTGLTSNRAQIAIGYKAMEKLLGGYYSIAIGGYALDNTEYPDECIAIGLDALGGATGSSYNIAIGNGASISDRDSYGNVIIGSRAAGNLNSDFGGYGENTFIGNYVASNLKNSEESVAIGATALQSATSNLNLSRQNIAIGNGAGWNWGSGSTNIWLGYFTNGFRFGSNNVIIGGNLSDSSINGSTSLSNSIILADGTGSIRLFSPSTGNILIGTTIDTSQKLKVSGTSLFMGVIPFSANNQTIAMVDIQPNFNRASYTGTTALALRVSGGTQIIGSGSTGTTLSVFSVDGASGRLFDVSDDLSSTLFSVNTIAGLPVIEAFANNAVVMGKYNQNTLVVSGTSVGIGTSSPQAKLDVSGTSIFRTGVTMNSSLTLGNVDITSAWSAYTPTWTAISSNPSIGNGSITGAFKVIGKTCFVRGRITMGSSTTYGSGAWLIGLPLPAINAYTIQITSSLLNNGNAWYSGLMNGGRYGNTSYSEIQVQNTSGTADGISSTYPFTWGDTDELSFNGSYEIA